MSKIDEMSAAFKPKVAAVLADVRSKGAKIAIEPIYGGRRTPEQQRKIVGAGHSKTLKSYHLTGDAADIYEYTDDEFTGRRRFAWPSSRTQFLIGSSALGRGIGWGGNFFKFDPLGIKRRRVKNAIIRLRELGWPETHELYSTEAGWDTCHIQLKANFV